MTSRTSAIEHPVRRLLIALPEPYDTAREHYEILVPEVDSARFHELESWQAILDFAAINAPHHFMRYATTDITQTMALSPSSWNATAYLMGNHTIAERMLRHDPSAMLHAPLRTLLYADTDGDTKFAVDQPSLLFASYGNPDIAAVGEELDGLLAALVELLGGDVPDQLRGLLGTGERLFPFLFRNGNVEIGPIPKDTPVSLLTSIDLLGADLPENERKAHLEKLLNLLEQMKRELKRKNDVFASQEVMRSLLAISKCPDYVINKGHYFGTNLFPEEPGLSADQKRDLIGFLKTM